MHDAAIAETSIRFPDKLRLRVPRGLPCALKTAAARHHTSPSEWARQALLRGLEADGVLLVSGCVVQTPLNAAEQMR